MIAGWLATPGFYDFFCGSAVARVGLEPERRRLFANDVDPRKGGLRRHLGSESPRIPGGGSSRQFLIVVDSNETRTRLMAHTSGAAHGDTRLV
jgi:hypothetical protein